MMVGAGVGLLFIVLGVPLFLRKIPPNSLYGLRTFATLDDESVWYDANAVSGRDTIFVGFTIIALAVMLNLMGFLRGVQTLS